jgi:membrane associated rhomboid family serine protease
MVVTALGSIVMLVVLTRALRRHPSERRRTMIIIFPLLVGLLIAQLVHRPWVGLLGASVVAFELATVRLAVWWGDGGRSRWAVTLLQISCRVLPSPLKRVVLAQMTISYRWRRDEEVAVDPIIDAVGGLCDDDRAYLKAAYADRHVEALAIARRQSADAPESAMPKLRVVEQLSFGPLTLEHLQAVTQARGELMALPANGRALWLLSSLMAWGDRDATNEIRSGQLRNTPPGQRQRDAAREAKCQLALDNSPGYVAVARATDDYAELQRFGRLVRVEGRFTPPRRWLPWSSIVLAAVLVIRHGVFVAKSDEGDRLAIIRAGAYVWGTLPRVVLSGDQYEAISASLTEQWSRAFTSMFLHSSWGHLAGNVVALLLLGRRVEWFVGHVRCAVLFVVCGYVATPLGALFVSTNAAGPFFTGTSIRAASGASGAVFALLGVAVAARVVAVVRWRLPWRSMGIPLLVGAAVVLLLPQSSGSQVFAEAHLAGFAIGSAIGVVLGLSWLSDIGRPLARPTARPAAAVVATGRNVTWAPPTAASPRPSGDDL